MLPRTSGKLLMKGAVLGALLILASACGGRVGTAAQAPQQPAPAAHPAPAAPAAEPRLPAAPPQPQAPAATAAPKPAGSAAAVPKYGGIATFANRTDPTAGWETMKNFSADLLHIGQGLFGPGNLVKPCRKSIYEVCLGLAETWGHNSDFTEWTFKIRNDVLWHDGTLFTADDAKFWVELSVFGSQTGDRKRAPAFFSKVFGDVLKVEALSGNRLRISLSNPAPFLLESIYQPFHVIAHPRHLMLPALEKGQMDVSPQDVSWVGTGPFKMLRYEKGTLAQTRRFDKYWENDPRGGRLPYLDGLDFAIIRDPAAMDAAFRVGRLDGGAPGTGHYLTKERKVGYVRDLGEKVWFAEIRAGRGGLNFNILKPGPWQDVRTRKAMALWLDKQAGIDAVLGSFGFLYTLLDPENPFTNPEFKTWPGWNPATKAADRVEAKRLMQEAGYPGGFRMDMACRRLWLERCEFYHAQFAGLGINVDLKLLDNAAWEASRLTLDYAVGLAGPTSAEMIPEATESNLTAYSRSRGAYIKHEDPKVVQFFQRLNVASSLDERVKLWRELERHIVLDQVYTISVFGELAVIPYRSYVKGRVVPKEFVNSDMDFATVWLDK